MTEDEYTKVRNLSTVNSALAVLDDYLPEAEDSPDNIKIRQCRIALSDIQTRLFKEIGELEET